MAQKKRITTYNRYNQKNPASYWSIVGIVSVVILWACCMFLIKNTFIGGKRPISKDYERTTIMVHDDENFFSDDEKTQIEEGLNYLYEKTGVEMVIFIEKVTRTEETISNEYNELFGDESHVLISYVPVKIPNQRFSWHAGTKASLVINQKAINWLEKNIGFDADGEGWKDGLMLFTKKLLEE